MGDGSCCPRTTAAVFDNDGDCILWLINWRVADEQRVVALTPRAFLVFFNPAFALHHRNPANLSCSGLAAGGKTGTAQVRRITMMERESGVKKNKERPWRERDHSLFVGYAPVDQPKYAVSVVVEHSGGGSRTAAPIAHDILKEVQRLYAPSQLARRGVT